MFLRPFTVLPRTSLTAFVAVSQSGNHKSLHVIHLLPNKDCITITEAQTETAMSYNIISITCFTTPQHHLVEDFYNNGVLGARG
jgi:hypothetical protein